MPRLRSLKLFTKSISALRSRVPPRAITAGFQSMQLKSRRHILHLSAKGNLQNPEQDS
ncbi:hypothetical protein PGT21_002494 [Puccinia graminis f. sp. tritici]|uniref:Uncharacterized protein n=1 Tax=Puccinia graminis f. sp. tritici TaxID=56615 RepID=A0A5B0LKK0_PUCGR|nr:hypothetical protein PGT21_002494 [Puccinia graminis f. sp. tritici]